MNKDLNMDCHPERSEGSFKRFFGGCPQNDVVGQRGHTLAETLGVLGIMTLLAVSAIKGYHFLTAGVKAQNTAKMIKTLAFERQNAAVADSSSERTVKGPHSSLIIKNGTPGNHQPYFWVETTLSDADFCEKLKESGLIQADLIEVDGVENGNCRDNSKIAFYFKKNAIANVYCPSHSTNCDTYGDATGCEMGYYLNGGKCSACGEHVATCEDEETPTSCMDGYNLYGTECSETAPCSVDNDCDVCGECGQDGYCTTMCSIPTPDEYNDCGENECMVYDDTTQTCQYACERKEYLESTGTQYIDLGFKVDDSYGYKVDYAYLTADDRVVLGTKGSGDSRWCLSGNHNPNVNMSWNTSYGSAGLGLNKRQVVQMNYLNDRKRFLNEVEKTPITTTLDASASSYNICMFAAIWGGGAANLFSTAKIYSAQISKGTDVFRDFIPVSSPKGNCMFDKVTKKLFCNAGTGDFLTD